MVGAILIVLACAFRALSKPWDGDFKLHWEFGRRFLSGCSLYEGGHNIPYPPFWAMAHSPAALLPMPTAKAILFPFGVGGLVLLLGILRRLSASAFALDRTRSFWVASLALMLAGRFAIRDMAELGVNTLLVTFTWAGIYLWMQRRELLAGLSLGTAIALKCTPLIFLAYFLWKRQWRMVAISGSVALLWTLTPMLWLGPASYATDIKAWTSNAGRGFTSSDPSIGVLGAEPLQNMSLRPALARFLIHLPAGHPGRAPTPYHLEFLSVSPVTAGWVIRLFILLLLAMIAWWSRRPIIDRAHPHLVWELAAVSIMMLLLSPITWGQHCVAALPASYFVSALVVTRGRLPRWMLALLAFYILFVPLLNRDLIGRQLALLLDSYHLATFALIALMAVIFGCSRLKSSRRDPGESVS